MKNIQKEMINSPSQKEEAGIHSGIRSSFKSATAYILIGLVMIVLGFTALSWSQTQEVAYPSEPEELFAWAPSSMELRRIRNSVNQIEVISGFYKNPLAEDTKDTSTDNPGVSVSSSVSIAAGSDFTSAATQQRETDSPSHFKFLRQLHVIESDSSAR